MNWRNMILYAGVICVVAGLIMVLIAASNRMMYYAGATMVWGLIISILGWIFYQRPPG